MSAFIQAYPILLLAALYLFGFATTYVIMIRGATKYMLGHKTSFTKFAHEANKEKSDAVPVVLVALGWPLIVGLGAPFITIRFVCTHTFSSLEYLGVKIALLGVPKAALLTDPRDEIRALVEKKKKVKTKDLGSIEED